MIMEKTKVLNVKEMKKVIGGNDVSCAVGIAVGAGTGGVIGAIGGLLTECVQWGYNETPQHGWN